MLFEVGNHEIAIYMLENDRNPNMRYLPKPNILHPKNEEYSAKAEYSAICSILGKNAVYSSSKLILFISDDQMTKKGYIFYHIRLNLKVIFA